MEADGGLGMVYDNTYTRTVAEVWRDRKANCLSLTAFYIAACDSIGIKANYDEALNTNRWRRVGSVIRFDGLIRRGTERRAPSMDCGKRPGVADITDQSVSSNPRLPPSRGA